MKATIETINQMQADGVIGAYAIGGAVGSTFYLEPAATVDLDIFTVLPQPAVGLISLTPIYDYLTARGGRVEAEYITVGGWPVQFIPTSNPLERDAVAQAISATVEGVVTRVMSAEHLVAIALQTGRSKDHNRILRFIEQDAVDQEKLNIVLEQHDLKSKWQQFAQKYLGDERE